MDTIKTTERSTMRFFRAVRKIGLILMSLSGTLLASPVTLPQVVKQIAGYMAVVGGVALALCKVMMQTED